MVWVCLTFKLVQFDTANVFLVRHGKTDFTHYVLKGLKSCQTYVFESRIAQGIQNWVQNSQLQALPELFSAPKIIEKIGRFVDF